MGIVNLSVWHRCVLTRFLFLYGVLRECFLTGRKTLYKFSTLKGLLEVRGTFVLERVIWGHFLSKLAVALEVALGEGRVEAGGG